MQYVLEIQLQGAEKASSQIDALNSKKESLTKDDTGALDAYWSKLEKVDKLAQSIVSGKWSYTAPKTVIGKMADESERLEKTLSKISAPGKGLDKLGKALMFGNWGYTAPASDPKENELERWRKEMATKVPKVSIYDPNAQPKNKFGAEGEQQDAVRQFGAGGLATKGQGIPQSQEEKAAAQKKAREKRIAREADFARRKDLMQEDAFAAMRDRAKYYRELTLLAGPIFNPGSVWASMLAARQVFSGLTSKTGQSILQGMGMKGGIGSAALVTGGLVALATGAGLALSAMTAMFKMAISEMGKSIQYARKIYGESLTTGLSTSFLARRNIAADVLGVDPKDVFRMQQMTYVTNELRGAIDTIGKTAPQLAYTAVQFKILEYNIRAAGARMASGNSPLINGLASGGSFAASHMEDSLAASLPALAAMVGAANFIAKKLGYAGTLGGTQSYMKQLPASAWEHMGLQIGGTMGGNSTPGLIREGNKYLKELVTVVKKAQNPNPIPILALTPEFQTRENINQAHLQS